MLINRELSWLEFNQRVLEEARDSRVPLLDRLSFLSITASNLDEFFMVRVGGLQLLVQEGVRKSDASGMSPRQQLKGIAARVHRMVKDQHTCYHEDLEPKLRKAGIRRVVLQELSSGQVDRLATFFEEEIFPVVSPMVVPAGAQFPALRNLGLHLAVRLKSNGQGRRWELAVVPIGRNMSRFVLLASDEGFDYVTIEDVIKLFVDRLFPGKHVLEAVPLRITRNADISAREDSSADFLAEMEEVLERRKESSCVRLEIKNICSRTLLTYLTRMLRVQKEHVYEVPGPMNLAAFNEVASLDRFELLRYRSWQPQPRPEIDLRKSIFDELSRQDILLHHPYDSFEPILRLIEEAASDPDVLAIKQVLYRTSVDSPVVAALAKAAEAGKYVTVIVELKARFDEARNIEWAKDLERSGVQVIYGVKGLKTHAKLCIVVRREAQGVVRYLHFGTGNYNEKTARLYSDIGYMTRDTDLGADASAFFNAVTGYSEPQRFLKLAAAPIGLREVLVELIESEAERKRQGQKAFIRAKVNSLVCPDIIKALYRASQAGVRIDLNVRGICCLRPGVKGLSRNITVVSIVDRFLEHSRILHFHHGGADKVCISSADWMPRNLDRRVELMVPVDDPSCRRKLIAVLGTYFEDTEKSWRLRADGTYTRRVVRGKRKRVRSQEMFCRKVLSDVKGGEAARRAVFEPHRPVDAGSR